MGQDARRALPAALKDRCDILACGCRAAYPRRMKRHLIIALATLLTIIALPSCSGSQLCTKAMPILAAGQAYSSDAQQALEQAQTILNGMAQLPADKKKIVQDGIDKARLALRAADVLIATGNEACSAPDVLAIFADFNKAWSTLKGLFGSNVGAGLVGAAPGATTGIQDPAIYRKAGGT